jgi:hypothetical protein
MSLASGFLSLFAKPELHLHLASGHLLWLDIVTLTGTLEVWVKLSLVDTWVK